MFHVFEGDVLRVTYSRALWLLPNGALLYCMVPGGVKEITRELRKCVGKMGSALASVAAGHVPAADLVVSQGSTVHPGWYRLEGRTIRAEVLTLSPKAGPAPGAVSAATASGSALSSYLALLPLPATKGGVARWVLELDDAQRYRVEENMIIDTAKGIFPAMISQPNTKLRVQSLSLLENRVNGNVFSTSLPAHIRGISSGDFALLSNVELFPMNKVKGEEFFWQPLPPVLASFFPQLAANIPSDGRILC
jgi:hypothetical protein